MLLLGTAERPARRRAWHPKVCSGCRTCKARRVRCDEQQPSCRRCIAAGRKCEGYGSKPLVGSGIDSTVQSQTKLKPGDMNGQKSAISVAGILPCSPSAGLVSLPSTQGREVHCFQFFCDVAGPALFNGCDQDFWLQALPRASHHNPAIWHAVISLGCLYERCLGLYGMNLQEDPSDTSLWFSIQQFNSSIRCLIGPQDSTQMGVTSSLPDKTITLAVSILFTTICNLRNLKQQAFVHLRGGLHLLQEVLVKNEASPRDLIPLHMFQGIFSSLDTQARLMLNDDGLTTWNFHPVQALDDMPIDSNATIDPIVLSTTAQKLYNNVIHSVQRIEQAYLTLNEIEATLKLHDAYRTHVFALNTALVIIKQCTRKSKTSANRLIAMAEIDLTLSEMFLSFGSERSDTRWDRFTPEFTRIVMLCGLVLQLYQDETARQKAVFLASANIVQTLWLVMARCRDPPVRRQALSLLQQFPRREGIWDSQEVWYVAQELMLLEEARSGFRDEDWRYKRAEDVLPMERVRDVAIIFNGQSGSIVRLRTHADFDAGMLGTERVIS